MHLGFYVYKTSVSARPHEGCAIRLHEQDTRNVFLARYRNPQAFLQMVEELNAFVKANPWLRTAPAPKDIEDHPHAEQDGP